MVQVPPERESLPLELTSRWGEEASGHVRRISSMAGSALASCDSLIGVITYVRRINVAQRTSGCARRAFLRVLGGCLRREPPFGFVVLVHAHLRRCAGVCTPICQKTHLVLHFAHEGDGVCQHDVLWPLAVATRLAVLGGYNLPQLVDQVVDAVTSLLLDDAVAYLWLAVGANDDGGPRLGRLGCAPRGALCLIDR